MSAVVQERLAADEIARQIAALLDHRPRKSFTPAEWDEIISLTDAHIAACARERVAYTFSPAIRARFDLHRQRARARTRAALGWTAWIS